MNRITNADIQAALARYQMAARGAGLELRGLKLISGSRQHQIPFRLLYADNGGGARTPAPGTGRGGFLGNDKVETYKALTVMAQTIEALATSSEMHHTFQ
jgi:hypothetical protein